MTMPKRQQTVTRKIMAGRLTGILQEAKKTGVAGVQELQNGAADFQLPSGCIVPLPRHLEVAATQGDLKYGEVSGLHSCNS
jgi:hypothetical protein